MSFEFSGHSSSCHGPAAKFASAQFARLACPPRLFPGTTLSSRWHTVQSPGRKAMAPQSNNTRIGGPRSESSRTRSSGSSPWVCIGGSGRGIGSRSASGMMRTGCLLEQALAKAESESIQQTPTRGDQAPSAKVRQPTAVANGSVVCRCGRCVVTISRPRGEQTSALVRKVASAVGGKGASKGQRDTEAEVVGMAPSCERPHLFKHGHEYRLGLLG